MNHERKLLSADLFSFFFSLIGREERGVVGLEVLNACLIGTHELKLFLPSLTMPTTLVLLFILQLYQHPISLHLFSRSRGQGNQKVTSFFYKIPDNPF